MIKLPPDTIIKWKSARVFPDDSELEGGGGGDWEIISITTVSSTSGPGRNYFKITQEKK